MIIIDVNNVKNNSKIKNTESIGKGPIKVNAGRQANTNSSNSEECSC